MWIYFRSSNFVYMVRGRLPTAEPCTDITGPRAQVSWSAWFDTWLSKLLFLNIIQVGKWKQKSSDTGYHVEPTRTVHVGKGLVYSVP